MALGGEDQLEQRVVLCAASPRDAAFAAAMFREAGLHHTIRRDLSETLRELDAGAGVAVLSDEELTPDGLDRLAAYLARQPSWSDLPLLVVTREAHSPTAAEAVARLGNVTLIAPPVRVASLISAVRTALRARGRQYQIRQHLEDIKRSEEALRQSQERLQALNESLERRVAERTAEAEQRAQQLRALAAEVTQAEQRERRRIAAALHDDLAQALVISKMKLAMVGTPTRNPRVRQAIEEAQQALADAIQVTRRLMHDISPPMLHDLGLVPALGGLAQQFRQQHGFHVEVIEAQPVPPLDEGERAFLFQAARELLTNALKYSKTTRARVILEQPSTQELCIRVEDDGAGFDPATLVWRPSEAGGFGLFNVRERTGLMGGRFEIMGAPGAGVRACITIPLRIKPEANNGHRKSPDASEPAIAPRHADRIGVILADDHQMVRKGLAGVLRDQPDIELLGEAEDGEAALELARRVRPSVAVIDVSMPRMSGVEATRLITAELPSVRVIGLSMHTEADMATRMREAGASAYLTKDGPIEALLAAIRSSATAPPAPKLSAAPA